MLHLLVVVYTVSWVARDSTPSARAHTLLVLSVGTGMGTWLGGAAERARALTSVYVYTTPLSLVELR